jgi:acyl-CoA dehydrogenase
MFLSEAHRALGDEIASRCAGEGGVLEDAPQSARWLGTFGLFELLVPPALGGRRVGAQESQVDVRALCVAREALAYVSPVADSILAVQGLGSHAAVLSTEFPHRSAFLQEVLRGQRIGAFALTEPDAGSDVASLRTRAEEVPEGWALHGEKCFISNVGIADHYLVFANARPDLGKKGISAFVVPATAPGLRTVPQKVGAHPLGRVLLDNCRVGADALVGSVGQGLRLALGTLDVFRTSVGAAAVGMARRALDETLARVQKRHQFGQPLADFQMTRAALAEMATELEAARLLVYRAAWAKDHGQETGTEVAMAKMFATESAFRIIDRAVQLHGGSGVEEGSVVEALYRDVRPLRIYEGTTEIQKIIVGTHLTKDSSS